MSVIKFISDNGPKKPEQIRHEVRDLFLKVWKFDITWGEVEESTFENSVTISRPTSRKEKKFHIFFTSRPLRNFFGTLWFCDVENGGNSNWVLDVYGKENLEEAENIADDLLHRFNVYVTVKLASDCLRYEPYPPGTTQPNFDQTGNAK